MGRRKGWNELIVAAGLVVGLASPVWAEQSSGSYMDGSLRKLGRGIANVATCPLELIRTPTLVGREDGVFAQLTVGLVQGAWHTIARGVTGVYEIATFYAPIPAGFRPIVKPEFVWKNGNWAENDE